MSASEKTRTVLITGAGGALGSLLVRAWREKYLLRVAARAPREDDLFNGIDARYFDLSDAAATEEATAGIDTIVHLAGRPVEGSWADILQPNIVGAYNVFEGARRNRVRRIIYASSHHVGGFHRRDRIISVGDELRPDSLYAVSKVFGEALGRLYADKHGLSVICQRIGVARPKPPHRRGLWAWQSERDYVHLTECCVEAADVHFLVVYGVSANSRKLWDIGTAEAIGYAPQDDAEDYAAALETQNEDALEARFHGGAFCAQGFDGDPDRID